MGCTSSKGIVVDDETHILSSLEKLKSFVQVAGVDEQSSNKKIDNSPPRLKAIVIEPDKYVNEFEGQLVDASSKLVQMLTDDFNYCVGRVPFYESGLYAGRRDIVDELREVDLVVLGGGRSSAFSPDPLDSLRSKVLPDDLGPLYELLLLSDNKTKQKQVYCGMSHQIVAKVLLQLLHSVISQTHELVFGGSMDDDVVEPPTAPNSPQNELGQGSTEVESIDAFDERTISSAVRLNRAASRSPIEILSELSQVTQKIDVLGNRLAVFDVAGHQVCVGHKHALFAHRVEKRKGLLEAYLEPYVLMEPCRKELKQSHNAIASRSNCVKLLKVFEARKVKVVSTFHETVTPEMVLLLNWAFSSIRTTVANYADYFASSKKFGWILNLPVGLEIVGSLKDDAGEIISEVGLVAIHFHNLRTDTRSVVFTVDAHMELGDMIPLQESGDSDDGAQQQSKAVKESREWVDVFRTLFDRTQSQEWLSENPKPRKHEPTVEVFVPVKRNSHSSNGTDSVPFKKPPMKLTKSTRNAVNDATLMMLAGQTPKHK